MAVRDMRHSNLKAVVMTNGQYGKTQTNEVYDYNQALQDEQFEILGNVETIEEESKRGSNIFTPIRASISITERIESKTKSADDVRRLTFERLDYDSWIGKRYNFSNNIWLTTNVVTHNSTVKSVVVQRCNNVLKWINKETNFTYEEPCVFDDKVLTTVDQQVHIQVIEGKASVILQYNENSKSINFSDRFIINGIAYRVIGIESAKRLSTYDKDNIGNITIQLEVVNINLGKDDIEENIANNIIEEIDETVLNGNVVTPNIRELSCYEPYNFGTYEVYNYIDGVKQADDFEFNFYDATSNKYNAINITPNSFTIKALDFSTVPLVVEYRNKVTNEIGEFSIVLRGVL